MIASANYKEAYGVLRKALAKQMISQQQEEPTFCENCKRMMNLVPVAVPSNEDRDDNDDDAMFAWPLLIIVDSSTKSLCRPCKHQPQSGISVEMISLACATALYNMGLACQYHLQQSRRPSQQRQMHSQAQSLYQQAYKIALDLDTDSTMPTSLLQLALCNNLVELATNVMDRRASEYWQYHFSQCMQRLPPQEGAVEMYYSTPSPAAPAA